MHDSNADSRTAVPGADDTTVGALLVELTGILASLGVPDSGREGREIVAALYDVPRFWPVVNGHVMVSAEIRHEAIGAARLRGRGAPFAYAVGRASFRTLTLAVDERVLIPRPETELLVEVVLDAVGPARGGIVIDVGTGSGALALSLAVEGPFERVIATDLSRDALDVAALNARALGDALKAEVELRHGSLLAPVAHVTARAIVSNPPYIAYPESAALPGSVRDWEPTVALLSGADGLVATLELIRQAAPRLEPGGVLALEVDARRAGLVAEALVRDGRYRNIGVRLDLAGRERFVIAHRTETE